MGAVSNIVLSLHILIFLVASTDAGSVTDYGGWRPRLPSDGPSLDDRVCNIDKISVLNLTKEIFEREYMRRKPLIITFPNGASDWTNTDYWTEPAIRQGFAGWRMSSQNRFWVIRKNMTRLRLFMDYIDEQVRAPEESELHSLGDIGFTYVDTLAKFPTVKSQYMSVKLPDILSADTSIDNIPIFLGGPKSGDKFHKHAESWNAVIYGRKRWFFYPGHQTPPGGRDPSFAAYHWYRDVYPDLAPHEKPIECVQEAGEILYMAESYYHCTMNVAETINIGSYRKEPTSEAEKLFYEAQLNDRETDGVMPLDRKDSNHTHVINTIHAILAIWPDQLDVLLRLGQEYHEIGELEKAREVLTRVIEKDPRTVIAFISLSQVHSSLKNPCTAEALARQALQLNPAQFWAYYVYARLLVQQKRHIDVVLLVMKGMRHLWMDFKMWTLWSRSLLELGLLEGARNVQELLDQLQ